MSKCPFCGIANVPNTVFCTHCGLYLIENNNRETDPLDIEDFEALHEAVERAGLTDDAPIDKAQTRIIHLKIGDDGDEYEVSLERAIHLGRIDPTADIFPEIDLSKHNPTKQISRRHARILKQNEAIFVEDLGSINGTYINGQILTPYLPQPLNNGDILQLGKLPIEVHFPQ